MKTLEVKGTSRPELGKKAAKSARNEGEIPAVVYSKRGTEHFSTTEKAVRHLVYSPDFATVQLQLEGSAYRCILKDVQFHPVTEEILHIDFLELIDGTPVKVDVPVRFKGVSPGVKKGGKLLQKVRKVKIKTLPENLVDELRVDISKLDLGQSVRVRDIEVESNIEVMNAPGIPVATIEIPRALRSAAQAAEKEKQAAAKKKK